MLKTSSTKSAKPRKDGVGIGGGNKARRDGSELDSGEIDGGEVEGDEVRKKVQKMFKSKETLGSDFFTFGAKLTFTKLRQAFFKALILYYFDLKRHMRIRIDVSGYAISRVLS